MKRRYALVTAGVQGLGQAITRHLAAQQYTLFVHYYTSQLAAEALQAELELQASLADLEALLGTAIP